MIELCYSTSPNVYKVMICLEELGLAYDLKLVDLSKGEQFNPENLGGSVAAKVPVIVDDQPSSGSGSFSVIESGAILHYLAEKHKALLPNELAARSEAMQWLFWQMAHLGPIGGQFWHFENLAPSIEPATDFSYPQRRYRKMLEALWAVLERRLDGRKYLAGTYSIADIACYPWVKYLLTHFDGEFAQLRTWEKDIAARSAVSRAYARNAAFNTGYERNERGGIAYPFDGLRSHTIVA